MKRDLSLFLEDILTNIADIESFVKDIPREKLEQNKLRTKAILRSLEVIGEAVKQIPQNLRDKHPKVPWRDVAGMRDVLIHAYFGIEQDQVWGVIVKDLPVLKKEVIKMLKEIV